MAGLTRVLPQLLTGGLFEASCGRGALFGPSRLAAALGCCGKRVGIAFQMLDDVLDGSGPPERIALVHVAEAKTGLARLNLSAGRRRAPDPVADGVVELT